MTLIQYIVLRKDLLKALKWPIGAIIAQACHASAAINEITHDSENTKAYLSEMDSMRKCVLGIEDLNALENLSKVLDDAGIPHKLWIEQPENVATCLATAPNEKEKIEKYFKDLKLLR